VKLVVSALAALARRLPWVVIIISIVLTAVLANFAGRAEIASGNEGFAPEGPEIQASERITEKFGDETSETTLQVILRGGGGDVITVEGLSTAMSAVSAIRSADVGEYVADRADRPGAFHYLATVEQAVVAQGIPMETLTDEMVKEMFREAIDMDGESDAPPEQASFIRRLVSEDFDEDSVTASSGMVLAFITAPEGATAEDSFNTQVELETALADDLAGIDSDLEVRPFSFQLLLSGTDDFTEEVGQLFGMAFAVILVILLFVYWLSPGGKAGWFASVRRTVTDMLLTLLTIVMAIVSMQGIGYLLEQAGVIDAFSAPTQIVPILLIGLGVDYAIHLTSRYREEVGSGRSVDAAMTAAVSTVGIALVLATVTTVVGFLTNLFNPVPALKDFGILSAVGIIAAFLLMLTFVPAVRMLADRRAERNGRLPASALQSHGERLLPRIMEKAAILSEHAAIPTLGVALLLGGLGFFGFTQLETQFSFVDFLPEDSPYVEALGLLEADFGGGFGEQTQVLVEGSEARPIDASVHNALVEANGLLTGVDDVSVIETGQGDFPNAASPISLLGQLLQGGPEASPPELLQAADQADLGADLRVADGADITSLYQAMLTVAPETASRVIHFEDGAIDALLWDITTTAGEDVADLRIGLDEAFEPSDGTGISAIATSNNIIGDVVVTELTESQSRSLFITVAVAGLVLIINFAIESRRWFLGVITIAPVGLVVLWTYGLMYATGIPFGPVTATLSALAIGIGVPFTIHIARRFQEDRKEHADLDDAMRATTRHTGGALAGSAFTTMAGFGILMTSSLLPFRQMGQVTVFAIGLALVASVLVLPSMLALWDRYHQRRGTPTFGGEYAERSAELPTR
jgi:uncharacterized protein